MADRRLYVQGIDYSLAGSGCTLTAVSITLSSMTLADGVTLVTMANFGTLGYATLEPETEREENISFTGITQNANGTATLTGVTRGLGLVSPYTAVAANRYAHAGGTRARVSNSAPFYNEFTNIFNDETIQNGSQWTFPGTTANARPKNAVDVDATLNEELITHGELARASFAGTVDATTVQKGIVQMATQAEYDAKTAIGTTGASLVADPSKNRATKYNDYILDTGAANAYAIAPVPAITAYVAGQEFTFLALNTNTGASTINVNTLGAVALTKNGTQALDANDIIAGQVCKIVNVGGVSFQLLTVNNSQNKYTVNADELSNSWFTYQTVMPKEEDGGVYRWAGWDATNVSVTATDPIGGANISGAAGYSWVQNLAASDARLISVLPGSGSIAVLSYYNPIGTKSLRIKFRAAFGIFGVGQFAGIGLTNGGAELNAVFNAVTDVPFRLINDQGTLYFANADGAAATTTDLTALGVVAADWNLYEIIYEPTSRVLLYVNGILRATHITNMSLLNTRNSLSMGVRTGAGQKTFAITPFVVSIES